MKQKDIFLNSEGDAWFNRNIKSIEANWDAQDDIILNQLYSLNYNPKNILEIGCGAGHRLNELQQKFKVNCCGIDPSRAAVSYAQENFEKLNILQATADLIPYENQSFDLVISGFCLYLADREDLFEIAKEYDRVLKDGGLLILWDFYASYPHKNKYIHLDNCFSYKMDYSKMFTWNPNYSIIRDIKFDHSKNFMPKDTDDIISLFILSKNPLNAFKDNF